MKKICFLLVSSLLIAVTSFAYAATSFNFMYTQDDMMEKTAQPAEEALVDNGSVYVKYHLSDADIEADYTNLFRVYKTNSTTGSGLSSIASKWVASNLNTPVLNHGTKQGTFYTVSGRINASYFLETDVNEIHLIGQFDIH